MGNLSLECPVCGKNIGIMEMPSFLDDARTIFCCNRCGKMVGLISTEPGNARRYFSKYKPQDVVVEKINVLFSREGVKSPYEEGGEVTEEELALGAFSEEKRTESSQIEALDLTGMERKVTKLRTGLIASFVVEAILFIMLIVAMINK